MVPVDTGVGEADASGEALADGHRLLRLVGPVVLVLKPQPVPVDRGLHVALVLGVDHDLRSLLHLQGRTGDGAVVAQHPHGRVAEPLGNRRDPQVELGTVGQLDDLGRCRLGQPGRVGGEVVG